MLCWSFANLQREPDRKFVHESSLTLQIIQTPYFLHSWLEAWLPQHNEGKSNFLFVVLLEVPVFTAAMRIPPLFIKGSHFSLQAGHLPEKQTFGGCTSGDSSCCLKHPCSTSSIPCGGESTLEWLSQKYHRLGAKW